MKKIDAPCKEAGCERPYYSSGWCRTHYNEQYRKPVIDGNQQCSSCKVWKPLSEFGGIKKPTPECKECHRERNRLQYAENKEQYTARTERDRKRRQATNRSLLIEYLSSHPCVDCGESDAVVLEFDHFGEKKRAISQMIASNTWENILLEIEKCEVRCANCHRRKTHTQFGYWGAEGGGANEF